MIDWKKVQSRLGCGVDGVPGQNTYAALLKFASHGRLAGDLAARMAAIAAVQFPRYEIDATPARLAQFLASTSHETGDYTVFSENLSYSVQNILNAWPSRFKSAAEAAPYAHNPPKLAEKVYGGRYGNPPGRAYDFRGGGLIQTTFYANYLAAEKATGLPLTTHPELLHDPLTSIEPACAYWKATGCNQMADADPSGRRARIAVNGGTIGLPDVLQRVPRLLAVLA